MAAPRINNRNRKVRLTYQKIEPITSRTGGLDTSLDAIITARSPAGGAGNGFELPFLACFNIPGSGLEHWELVEDAVTVADGVFVVDPLDFHAVTNPRKWKRVL